MDIPKFFPKVKGNQRQGIEKGHLKEGLWVSWHGRSKVAKDGGGAETRFYRKVDVRKKKGKDKEKGKEKKITK